MKKVVFVPGLLLFLSFSLIFCSKKVPLSTETKSDRFTTLEEKVAFLEKYVTFRRHYQSLDYMISFHDNSSGIPGPSDWKIAMIAKVPSDEISQWLQDAKRLERNPFDSCWNQVPNFSQTNQIAEWYVGKFGQLIGLDRQSSLVAYCNQSR